MTWIEYVQRIGAQHGVAVDDRLADWALWEWTPFPMGVMEYVTRRLRIAFAQMEAGEDPSVREPGEFPQEIV